MFLTNKLLFDLHVSKVTGKALRMLGFIKRNCRPKGFKTGKSILSLYNSMVRSVLEYAAPVWSPWPINKLEDVRKKFLKYLCKKCNKDYNSEDYQTLLKGFNLCTLENRRKYLQLSMLHKCLHSEIDCVYLIGQINLLCTNWTQRRKIIFKPDICRINLRQRSFLPFTQQLYDICN